MAPHEKNAAGLERFSTVMYNSVYREGKVYHLPVIVSAVVSPCSAVVVSREGLPPPAKEAVRHVMLSQRSLQCIVCKLTTSIIGAHQVQKEVFAYPSHLN